MRQWMIPAGCLCDKHLGGEYVEGICALGSIAKGISMQGYINKGLLEIHNIRSRWDEIRLECQKRGRKTNAIPKEPTLWAAGKVDKEESVRELKKRCSACRIKIEQYEHRYPI